MKIIKYIFTIAVVAGLLVFVVFHLIPRNSDSSNLQQQNNTPQASGNSTVQSTTNSSVPSFMIMDLKGKEKQLDDYKDKLILVNFWASWCGPCNEEAPSMEKMYKELRSKGLVVVGISIDHHVSQVEKFVKEYSITFPVLLDTDENVASSYGITGVPETFILNRNYKLIKHIIGPIDWTSPDATNYLSELLKEEK
jgi:peroxiredoxin